MCEKRYVKHAGVGWKKGEEVWKKEEVVWFAHRVDGHHNHHDSQNN